MNLVRKSSGLGWFLLAAWAPASSRTGVGERSRFLASRELGREWSGLFLGGRDEGGELDFLALGLWRFWRGSKCVRFVVAKLCWLDEELEEAEEEEADDEAVGYGLEIRLSRDEDFGGWWWLMLEVESSSDISMSRSSSLTLLLLLVLLLLVPNFDLSSSSSLVLTVWTLAP